MDCYGVIDFTNERTILFIPRLDELYEIWMEVLKIDEAKKKYDMIDEIRFVDELESYFKDAQPDTVYVNKGVNSDSGLTT